MNNSWARKTAATGVLAAGAVIVAGAGTAHADGGDIKTSDQVGAVDGNQVVAPIQVPVNICGVAAAALGHASAGCEGGAEAASHGPAGDMRSQGNYGLVNGDQLYAPVQAPIEVSGIAAAVGGASEAWSRGGSSASFADSGSNGDMTTRHNAGLLNGNQLLAPVQAPVNACGNAIAVGGAAESGCEGGAEAGPNAHGGNQTSKDNAGLGDGNQVFAPVQAPVNVCGNAIAVLGYASASCEGGSDGDVPGDEDGGNHKKRPGTPESAHTAAAEADRPQELPATGDLPGLDTVATDLPLVEGLTGSASPESAVETVTDTAGGITEAAGAGLL